MNQDSVTPRVVADRLGAGVVSWAISVCDVSQGKRGLATSLYTEVHSIPLASGSRFITTAACFIAPPYATVLQGCSNSSMSNWYTSFHNRNYLKFSFMPADTYLDLHNFVFNVEMKKENDSARNKPIWTALQY